MESFGGDEAMKLEFDYDGLTLENENFYLNVSYPLIISLTPKMSFGSLTTSKVAQAKWLVKQFQAEQTEERLETLTLLSKLPRRTQEKYMNDGLTKEKVLRALKKSKAIQKALELKQKILIDLDNYKYKRLFLRRIGEVVVYLRDFLTRWYSECDLRMLVKKPTLFGYEFFISEKPAKTLYLARTNRNYVATLEPISAETVSELIYGSLKASGNTDLLDFLPSHEAKKLAVRYAVTKLTS